jgi:hypothetical protein
VRYKDASGKFVWSQAYDTLEEARKESAGLELNAKAVNGQRVRASKNAHRTVVKTAIEHFVSDAKKSKKSCMPRGRISTSPEGFTVAIPFASIQSVEFSRLALAKGMQKKLYCP